MHPHSETDRNNPRSLIYIFCPFVAQYHTAAREREQKRREMHIQRPMAVEEIILKWKRCRP